jgi:hypothetical protein
MELLGLVAFFVVVPLLAGYLVRQSRRRGAAAGSSAAVEGHGLHRALPGALTGAIACTVIAAILLSAWLLLDGSDAEQRNWAIFGFMSLAIAMLGYYRHWQSRPAARPEQDG